MPMHLVPDTCFSLYLISSRQKPSIGKAQGTPSADHGQPLVGHMHLGVWVHLCHLLVLLGPPGSMEGETASRTGTYLNDHS